MPRPTTTRPGEQFGPPATEANSLASIALGDAIVRLGRLEAEVTVAIAVREERRELRFATAAVARWCDDAALLLASSLDVHARDEVELRTPMLVARDGHCVALSRLVTSVGSTVRLLLTPSPEQAAAVWRSAPDAPTAAHALVRALRDLAG